MKNRKNNSGGEELSPTTEEKTAQLSHLFGQNLSCIRRDAGYSQLALAVEVDLTPNFINELEQGAKTPSFETLMRLSHVLRAPVDKFFEQDEETVPDTFRYPDQIDSMVNRLHEMIDTWNEARSK
jgi:transcriptional regulator with XRE-family HTH domain